MKAPAMRVTRVLVLSSFCTLPVSTAAAAQGAFPPVVQAVPSPSTPRAAWLERFQESRSGPESSEKWSRTFKVGPTGSLDLSNISGDIVITGGAGDEIRVDAVKRAHGHNDNETRRQLEGVTIEAREHAGRVEISTMYPRKQNSQVDVDYTVHVPTGAAVSVRSVSGNIELTALKGEARLETVSGNVTTTNSRQLARVKSVSGDVAVSEGSSGDVLSLGTVSGNLTVRRLKARTLEVQTISGDLSLTDAVCDRVQAKTISGDLQFGGPLAKAGRYEFNSHSGDVRLSLQGTVGFEITASTFSGDLRSDLQLSGRGGSPAAVPAGDDDDDDDRGHGPRRQDLRGTFGDGSAIVMVQTFSGDLVVTGTAKK
jgi:DUF4097 and DUF4098 domain-containing protein YvlB